MTEDATMTRDSSEAKVSKVGEGGAGRPFGEEGSEAEYSDRVDGRGRNRCVGD